jgi:glycerate-2-kinase
MSRGIIKNVAELTSHGNQTGRTLALRIIERSLLSMDSNAMLKRIFRLRGETIHVGKRRYDLDNGRVFIIGAGKATLPMAAALDEILGDRIERGLVIAKRGQSASLKHIDVVYAGHPLPDKSGYSATTEIKKIAEEASENDLCICLISGGASALMPSPVEGITLGEERQTTRLLLNSGASIDQINAVRNHISSVKGGMLGLMIHPAEIINFIVVDEPDNRAWGPTVPDTSTFKDAFDALRGHRLLERVPASVRAYIRRGLLDPSLETPKERDFMDVILSNYVLGDNPTLCAAAKHEAETLGLRALVLTSRLEGESREAGRVLASIALEAELRRGAIEPPCVLIAGGETTVRIERSSGGGGPSQELIASCARSIAGSANIVVASIDTDGTDGPTDVAGAVADGFTAKRALALGIDLDKAIVDHDTSTALRRLGDAIMTGATGTNVMDLNLIVVTGFKPRLKAISKVRDRNE